MALDKIGIVVSDLARALRFYRAAGYRLSRGRRAPGARPRGRSAAGDGLVVKPTARLKP